jgi:hypothetical protein
MTEAVLSDAELAADASSEIPSDHALAEVAQLAERQVALELKIQAAEAGVEAMRAELLTLSGKLLPDAMRALGLTTLKLATGEKVEVKPILRASISEVRAPEAFAWLTAHGFGDLIKHRVEASFGKGEDEAARAFLEAAAERGVSVSDLRSVHPGTLAAFVREQDEAGRPLPEQLFGVYRADTTKITRPRAK